MKFTDQTSIMCIFSNLANPTTITYAVEVRGEVRVISDQKANKDLLLDIQKLAGGALAEIEYIDEEGLEGYCYHVLNGELNNPFDFGTHPDFWAGEFDRIAEEANGTRSDVEWPVRLMLREAWLRATEEAKAEFMEWLNGRTVLEAISTADSKPSDHFAVFAGNDWSDFN